MSEERQITRHSGLYRCSTCGAQVYVSAGMQFPSCALPITPQDGFSNATRCQRSQSQ